MNRIKAVLVLLLLGAGFKGFALDYGLVINQAPVVSNEVEDEYIKYTALVRPWFSSPLGEKADLYLSGGLTARYEEKWAFLPEVSRFEVEYRLLSTLSLELGRFAFRDPLGFVFAGLFDGLGATWDIDGTQLRGGALYTGLLYKKTASITMTGSDLADYNDEDIYFASRRLAFAVNWTIPALFDSRNSLELAALAQIDLNDGDKLHSQYLLSRWTRSLNRGWYMDLGATIMFAEWDGDTAFGFALSLAPFWVPSSRPGDRLFFTLRAASGNQNDTVKAFIPVTNESQGNILGAAFSGLAWAQAGYRIRLLDKLQGEASAAWFFRTDEETFTDKDLNGSDSSSLGAEAWAAVTWVPESWCSFNLGSGLFFPHTGGAYSSDADIKWRIAASLILSF